MLEPEIATGCMSNPELDQKTHLQYDVKKISYLQEPIGP